MDDNSAQDAIDIEALLARMALPERPSEAVAAQPKIASSLQGIALESFVSVLGGLMTEPLLQANHIRLDWAMRLAIAFCRGERTATRQQLDRLINHYLVETKVSHREDPNEDFFVVPIGTTAGEFLVLRGQWENGGLLTENVLAAFEALPDAEPKADATRICFALLKLSDAVLRRARLDRYALGQGERAAPIKLPSQEKLRSLARRVKFTWAELDELGIAEADIRPFILDPDWSHTLLNSEPGDSFIDFRPLIATQSGVILAAPTNVTTAVRALLIGTAIQGGMERRLQFNLLDTQAEMLRECEFLRPERAAVARLGNTAARQYMKPISLGHFVHVIHVADNFDGFPDIAFGSLPPRNHQLEHAIAVSVDRAKQTARARTDFVAGLTFCFVGGWGRPYEFGIPQPDADWPLIVLTPADAFAMAKCEDGSLKDAWRLILQLQKVEDQGFALESANGFANLFQWWRETHLTLVPDDMTEVEPPYGIHYPLDGILAVRREGLEAIDRRVLRHPDGTYKFSMRMESKGFVGDLEPIYGSLDAIARGDLLGTALVCPCLVWLALDPGGPEIQRRQLLETWHAALRWMARTLPLFWQTYAAAASTDPMLIVLSIGWPEDGQERSILEDLSAAIDISIDASTRSARIHLKPEWHWGLHHADNRAEIALAAALLHAVSAILGNPVPTEALRQLARGTAGEDIRWRHSFRLQRVIDSLRGHGLIAEMRAIPASAAALLKCGSVWPFRPRDEGTEILGRVECRDFLAGFAQFWLQRLIGEIRSYNRGSFVRAALNSFQAALGETRHWGMTARAMRAIHGPEADLKGSLQRTMQANALMRANSMLIEIANAEAPETGGLQVGDMSLVELQTIAMLIFQNLDLAAAIYGKGAEAAIRISPTGDVLIDNKFERATIQKSATRLHNKNRIRDDVGYHLQPDEEQSTEPLDAGLLVALAHEFGVDAEAALKLPAASGDLAADVGQGVVIIRRSEFLAYLQTIETMGGKPMANLVDRLTMPRRKSWTDLPPGWTKTDTDLSKFERRYSVIARPIIALSGEADPELAIAPAVIERTFVHNIASASTGSLQNEFWFTREMQSYASSAGARAGLKFNEDLSQQIAALGFEATPSAKPSWCLNIKATRDVEALGDLDVLVLNRAAARVWVVEAKDLKMCRTLGEITRRLSEYRGCRDTKGRPDKMLRHLQRVAFLRSHAANLQRFFKLETVPAVDGVVVVSSPQPMEHLQTHESDDARVVLLDDLDTVPWDTGWQREGGRS